MKEKSSLIVFGDELPLQWMRSHRDCHHVVVSKKLKHEVEALGFEWIDREELTDPGSIYEASALVEELSRLTFPDGSRIAKGFTYKGFDLWWMHYNDLYRFFCLPYTQNKRLLEFLKSYRHVYLYKPSYKDLFSCYLRVFGVSVSQVQSAGFRSPAFLPFGVFMQIVLTVVSLPVLIVFRRRVLVFTGDKFEESKDHDFRMRFIYEGLRRRNISFVEFIRSLESWKTVIRHAIVRRRPVVYSEAVATIGRFISVMMGGPYRAEKRFGEHVFASVADKETRFKLLVATRYLVNVHDDVWGIRLMRWIVRAIGVRVVLMSAATERSFHTVLACKLINIPTIGILHGVSSRYYNVYEFMPGFDGEKVLTVDKYGLWSSWWQMFFRKYSDAYKPEQLYVSGPMRPLLKKAIDVEDDSQGSSGRIKVLFISEEAGVPREALPFIYTLLDQEDMELTIKFRPYRDGFEEWILRNEPDLLKQPKLKIVKGGMQNAIKNADVVVGSFSTAVLEAVIQLKPLVFYRTEKWGDYYSLKENKRTRQFFAENKVDLVRRIKNARNVSRDTLVRLREQYFGDPYQNGSEWVVKEAVKVLQRKS